MGLKIIFTRKNNMTSLIVNNPVNLVNIKLNAVNDKNIIDAEYTESDDEIDMVLYDEDDNFICNTSEKIVVLYNYKVYYDD